ncbi:MAG: arginine decarboxylase, pyruvoyl-dependent [Candidatus Brocadiae bacterium]|nr:arginine decarboxylase, pyruvoyl-dependent [Candidatus Brocadiia bacterium]
MGTVPNKIFFTKGVGVHKERLQSFELALRKAGIQMCNIVKVSSIFPPNCEIISQEEGLKLLKPGEILYCVLAQISTSEPQRLMSASVGLAVPADRAHYGYISEYHGFGEEEKYSSDYTEDLAASMLASTLGIEFDPDESYDERREIYQMSGKIINSRSITQTTRGDADGRWTTAIAAAVFICD